MKCICQPQGQFERLNPARDFAVHDGLLAALAHRNDGVDRDKISPAVQALAVNVPAMADLDDLDHPPLLVDGVDDAPIALPDPVALLA